MNVFALLMLAAPLLLIIALALLALIVAGIRRADRHSLRDSSGDQLDSFTHRLVGGVRNASRTERDR
jgi:hypothetical protein